MLFNCISGIVVISCYTFQKRQQSTGAMEMVEDTMDCIGSEPISFETRDTQSLSHSTQPINQNMNESSILLLDTMEIMTLVHFLQNFLLRIYLNLGYFLIALEIIPIRYRIKKYCSINENIDIEYSTINNRENFNVKSISNNSLSDSPK